MQAGEFDGPVELETRRVGVFLLVAFGVAWATAGVIYETGGLTDSRELVAGFTVATVLLPTAYMFAPGVANVATRLATGEGWDGLLLRPRLRRSLRTYALAWLVPAVMTVIGTALFFALFPAYFDSQLTAFGNTLSDVAGEEVDPSTVVAIQVVVALTIAPIINAVFAFGEEFGWRAYLLPKLTPLGLRRAVVLHGLIWGAWHWPLILMGYEYGFAYPGAPWTGLLVFLVFTTTVGTFLAWVTIRSGSVWPAAIGHGAVNAITGVGLAFLRGEPNLLLGPIPHGLIAGIPWLALAIVLLYRTARWKGELGQPAT